MGVETQKSPTSSIPQPPLSLSPCLLPSPSFTAAFSLHTWPPHIAPMHFGSFSLVFYPTPASPVPLQHPRNITGIILGSRNLAFDQGRHKTGMKQNYSCPWCVWTGIKKVKRVQALCECLPFCSKILQVHIPKYPTPFSQVIPRGNRNTDKEFVSGGDKPRRR